MKKRRMMLGFLFAVLMVPQAGQVLGNIPDTGQRLCYDNSEVIPCPMAGDLFYGQDAHYSIHPPSFTKLDANGDDLPDTATSWAMVRDNVTGLIWEIKQNKDLVPDYTNPRDADNEYTWYNPDPLTNGGNAGTPGNGTDTLDFIDALNTAGYGGFSDWRMPSAKELQSIVNYDLSVPAVHDTFFPMTPALTFWSSSPSPLYTVESAWTVNFYSGSVSYIEPKSTPHHMRAVRSGKPALLDDSIPSERLTDNGDGTITDTSTGLVWQQRDDGVTRDWESALQYCETLDLAGYNDWRMPTIKELISIVDMTSANPSVLPVFTGISASYYWSGTSFSNRMAWSIVFFMGHTESANKTDTHYVRAVRAGGSDPSDTDDPVSPAVFSGTLTSDVSSGLAPVTVRFDTFVARGDPPFIYDYDFGDGTSRVNGNRQEYHTYLAPGEYTATVTVIDAANTVLHLGTTVLVLDITGVDTLTESLQANAGQVPLAPDGERIGNLLQDTDEIVRTTLTSIAAQTDEIKVPIQKTVRSTVEKMVIDTDTALGTLIENNKVTTADLTNIASGIGGVVSSMVKNRVPVTGDTVDNLTAISETIYTRTLDTLLEKEQLDPARMESLKTDRTESRDFFRNKPYLLDDLAADTGIRVDTTKDFKADDITARGDRHQLTETQTGLLFNAVEKTLDISGGISSSPDISGNTIERIAEHIYNTYFGKTVVNTSMDNITQSLLLAFSDGTRMSVVIKSVSVVTDFMPAGLFTLPNGNQLGVTDTYALEFTAYPAFPHALAAEIIKLDFAPVLTRDKGLRVQLDPSVTLSLKSGYEYFKSNTFDSLVTSIRVVGGSNPAAEAYALLATYDTGFSQLLPPAIMALDRLTRLLDTLLMPGTYRLDPATGVLTMGGLKLKPDYVFINTEKIDYAAITAAGGFIMDKLAFEMVDVNNDGLMDIILHSDSPMGRQVLYTIKE